MDASVARRDRRPPGIAPEAFAERAHAHRDRDRQGHRRPAGARPAHPRRAAREQPRAPRGRPRPGQDDARPDDRRRHRLHVQPDPVHARPDAGRHHRHEHPRRGGRRAGVFKFQPGPIFANLVLADEINRATPKTQSALLEAMQEHQVTVAAQPLHARPAVLRPGDPEPDRDGGHLPAPRGAARPVPVQGHGPVPVRGGPGRDPRPHDGLGRADRAEGRHGRRDRRDAAARARGPDRARTSRRTPCRCSRRPTPTTAARRAWSASTSATAARRAAPRRS